MKRSTAALSLGGVYFLFFFRQLLSSDVPFYRDQLVTLLPLRAFARRRLLEGAWPEWFPSEGLGLPFIGQLVTQTFHPFTWLTLPLAPDVGLKAATMAAYLLGLVGAYRLARTWNVKREHALVAAFFFGFGGYALGVSSNLVYLLSHCSTPWALWAARRLSLKARWSDVAALSATMALVFLSGDVQGFIGAVVLTVAVFLLGPRQPVVKLAVAGLVTGLLIAPELLPALAVSADSARRALPGATQGTVWALAPLRLPELLWSGFIPDAVRNVVAQGWLGETRGGLWSTTITMGALAGACLAAGVRADWKTQRWLLVVLVGALWLALGERGGLWSLAAAALPPVSWFRYPEKYLSLVWVAAIPSVALGAQWLHREPRRGVRWLGGFGVASLLGGAVLGQEAVVAALLGSTLGTDEVLVGELATAWQVGAVVAGGAALLGALSLRATPRFRSALPFVAALELFVANGAHLPLVPRSSLSEPNPLADAVLQQTDATPRVMSLRPSQTPLAVTLPGHEAWVRDTRLALRASSSSLDGVASFGSNLALIPTRLAKVQAAVGRDPALLARYGVCFVTVPVAAGRGALAEQGGVALIRRPCAPRIGWARAARVGSVDEALTALRDDDATTQWEGEGPLEPGTGALDVQRDTPERLELRVDTERAGALVVREQLAVGWAAFIDDVAVTIFPVDGALRGVVVPEGKHTVRFVYEAPGLRVGMWLGVLGLLSLLALGLTSKVRRQPS